MKQAFHVMIPARYHSTRLPGKLLMTIDGMTVLERVWHQAVKAEPTSITIATDNVEIAEHARSFGATVCMTSPEHTSGTDRIAEVVQQRRFSEDSIIVNLQGDEPFIAPQLIRQVAALLMHTSSQVATLCWPIDSLEQFNNPNVVKVVFNHKHQAMYFSRSPIPVHRDVPDSVLDCWRHIGMYAYRTGFLNRWNTLPICSVEQHECLEQLRILWSGFPIEVAPAEVLPLQDINTHDDLMKAREWYGVKC